MSVSKRDTVPELAAVLSRALFPATALIAGVAGSPLVVVGVFVSCKTSVDRLPEQSRNLVLDILARPARDYQVSSHLCERHHLVELSYG